MVYMYHSFLIHSSADGHLGCFNVLAIINSAAMNIGVHVSLSDLVEEGFLISLCYFWNSAFKWDYLSFSPLFFASLPFTAVCKASSDNHFALLHFFSMGMVLISVSCIMSRTSVHSSSGTLSDLVP